jgi:hypothetical protein
MNTSPFEYSLDNKRYHTLNYHNLKKYGHKIYKAVLDCGFTCPNIDGTKGFGGCIFCDGGSGYFTRGDLDTASQLKAEKSRIISKYGDGACFVAYFQANTNTYAPLEKLRKIFLSVLEEPNVCGISIGTRADCLDEDVIGLLQELSEKTDLTVELGMQSCHDKTLKLINRCYTHSEFRKGYFRLKAKGIRTCIHIINGLPGETDEMMLETAAELAMLSPDAIKLQMLHVIKGTTLADMFQKREIRILDRDEYINIIVKQLELLPPQTVIERITGDGDKSKLIAPMWSTDKLAVLGGIDKRLADLDTWQGKYYKKQV